MGINLSDEMIYKVVCVATGRLRDLRQKEVAVKTEMTVGESQIRRKRNTLNAIEKAKTDAAEVYDLFSSLMNDAEECSHED